VNNWVENENETENEKEEYFSLAQDGKTAPDEDNKETPRESITQLGSSYKIKDVTINKKEPRSFPIYILILIVVLPVIFIFVVSALSKSSQKKDDSFIYDTLESKYFTINVPPGYQVDSITDKKIPYLEQHTLTSNDDGQKVLTITVKAVSLNYDLANNKEVSARRSNPGMYSEEPYTLNSKEGLYFKKTSENFEDLVVLVDRNRNLLYEIKFLSTTNFSNNADLEKEFQNILQSMTFL
jgi:hypothetical protein